MGNGWILIQVIIVFYKCMDLKIAFLNTFAAFHISKCHGNTNDINIIWNLIINGMAIAKIWRSAINFYTLIQPFNASLYSKLNNIFINITLSSNHAKIVINKVLVV